VYIYENEKGAFVTNSLSDNEIMFNVKDGQLDQLSYLFDRHNVKLYNYFVMLTRDRALSEDLTQDVFLRILRSRHTFKGKGLFTSWMFQIARNVGIDHFRKSKNIDSLDDQYVDIESEDATPFEESSKNEQVTLLQRAMENLSPHHKEVLMLARIENLPLKDVAKILGCPVNTVKVRIHRAVKELGTLYFKLEGVS